MKEKIDHTFAVVAYKDSPYLIYCIRSLLAQEVESTIYISTSTPSPFISRIAEQFNVHLFITEGGKGIAHDWNFAFQQAKTKYVTIAHQDDIYLPEYSSKCFKTAERFTDALICFTGYKELVNSHGRKTTYVMLLKRIMLFSFLPLGNTKSIFFKKSLLAFGCPISCPTVFFNKKNLHNFSFSTSFSISLDWDAWNTLARRTGRFIYIPSDLVFHRLHSESATSEGIKASVRAEEDRRILSKIWPPVLSGFMARLYSKSYETNKF